MKEERMQKLLAEVRDHWLPPGRGPNGDFRAVSEKLFVRIAHEEARHVPRDRQRRHLRRGAVIAFTAAGVLAVAAAVFVYVRTPDRDSSGIARTQSSSDRAGADREGNGKADVETERLVETGAFRTWLRGPQPTPPYAPLNVMIDTDSRAIVSPSSKGLVLALLVGAVETERAPGGDGTNQPSAGDDPVLEVDVEAVRIVARSTKLRVARQKNQVVVDLHDGSMTLGGRSTAEVPNDDARNRHVSAPAHVEFDALDPAATLRVRNDVRGSNLDHVRDESRRDDGTFGTTPRAPVEQAGKRATDPDDEGTKQAPISSPSAVESVSKGVEACMAMRPANGVSVRVSTSLTIQTDADGVVKFARFTPPLRPEAQDCAARVIYKSKFPRTATTLTIPIAVE